MTTRKKPANKVPAPFTPHQALHTTVDSVIAFFEIMRATVPAQLDALLTLTGFDPATISPAIMKEAPADTNFGWSRQYDGWEIDLGNKFALYVIPGNFMVGGMLNQPWEQPVRTDRFIIRYDGKWCGHSAEICMEGNTNVRGRMLHNGTDIVNEHYYQVRMQRFMDVFRTHMRNRVTTTMREYKKYLDNSKFYDDAFVILGCRVRKAKP